MVNLTETWIEERDTYKIYLNNEGGPRWIIKDQRKSPCYQILYTEDGLTMQTPDELVTACQFNEPLESLDQSIDFNIASDEANYTLESRQAANWELAVMTKSTLTTFSLLRQTEGWNIYRGPDIIATMRKNPGESKLGSVRFSKRITKANGAGILMALVHAITSANARFYSIALIPASTEYDSAEKYGCLESYRPKKRGGSEEICQPQLNGSFLKNLSFFPSNQSCKSYNS